MIDTWGSDPLSLQGELLERCLVFFRQRNVETYLVGGSVRDQLLGRVHDDLDFVVAHNALHTTRELANRLGGAFYPLDSERDTGRIVMPNRAVVDIALMRGATIDADLASRDFTINAMARRITDLDRLIDPFHGAADLDARCMRAVSDQAFVTDAVRMMRAIRQSAELGFAIAPETLQLMQRDRMLLAQVSGERVRDELVKMLKMPMAPNFLEALHQFDYLTLVLPHAQWNEQTKFATDQLDALNDKLYGGSFTPLALDLIVQKSYLQLLGDYVGELLTDGRTRLLVFPLAVLYSNEANAQADLRRLKYGRPEIEFARALLRHREALVRVPLPVAALDAHRFFRDSSSVGLGLIYLAFSQVIAQADRHDTLQRIAQLLDFYTRQHESVIAPKPLLNGAEIAKRFNLRGAPIGNALRELLEAQVRGDVRTRDDAQRFLSSMLDRQSSVTSH